MRKIIFLGLLSALLLLSGCGKSGGSIASTEQPADMVTLYYIDMEEMTLEETLYHISDPTATLQSVEDITKQLFTNTEWNERFTLPLPEFMTYHSFEMGEGNTLNLYMDISYQDDMKWLEVLSKAAIVKSLCQLPYVENVAFVMNDLAQQEPEGQHIETYSAEDFVVSSADGGYVQNGEIRLYFANEEGSALKEYSKLVEITNNISLEQLVIDSMLTGPLREGYITTLPEGTLLNKISVKDGTAYVNFNEAFAGAAGDIRSELTVYSVVNSLCELPTINRVQILINGEKQETYRETVDISNALERNLDLIEQEAQE
ncbi:MAG: GerMN domain-containing protein [Lachnospiraceae bacterium]|nr:GerMN domain-containing protein [Lachnospiraceae bacterium]